MLALGAVAAATAFAVKSHAPGGSGEVPPVVPRVAQARFVRLAPVKRPQQTDQAVYDSVVRSVERARVAFTQGGRILSSDLVSGMRVTEGQVLAGLVKDSASHEKNAREGGVRAHQAKVSQAIRDAERAREMEQRGVGSAAAVEHAETELKRLREAERALSAGLKAARFALAESTLRAPFDGTVAQVLKRSGDFAAGGEPVVTIHGDALEVAVHVPQRVAAQLTPGTPVNVRFPSSAEARAEARVRSASTVGVPPSNLCVVVLSLADVHQVFSGQAVQVHVEHTRPSSAAEEFTVPLEAVIDTFGSRPHVFRVDQDTARAVDVLVRRLSGTDAAVTGALKPGEQVVTAGHRWVMDGDSVTVVK